MNSLSWPAIVALEITPNCNNRCPGCSNIYADDRERSWLPAEQWVRWLATFAPEAVQMRLTGGEPTLHPEFIAIFEAATDYDAQVTVFSNGRWRNPEQLIQRMKGRRNFSGFLISLHGACAETHESFTHVSGSFVQAVQNIQLAVQAGIPVAISTVLTQQSWRETEEVVQLAKQLGAKHVAFNRYLGAPDPSIEPSTEDFRQAVASIEKMLEAGESIKYGIGVPQCFVENGSDGCLAGVAYVSIDPWGRLRPCAHSPAILGSLGTRSFFEIWNSQELQNWRSLMPAECLECAAYAVCHGGCRAVQELRPDKKDVLRCEPMTSFRRRQTTEKIPAELRPVQNCRIRQEGQGFAALGNGYAVLITSGASDLLQACNGTQTVQSLTAQYGSAGLNLIGDFLQKGLLKAV